MALSLNLVVSNFSKSDRRLGIGTPSVVESKRLSLLVALSSQALSTYQKGLNELFIETVKYVNPSRQNSPRNLEEAFMTVPDLETVPYQVVKRNKNYEIRLLESYLVAETTVPSDRGFDFYGSSQAFNTIAAYLFGKNESKQEMAMTTPVFVNKEGDTKGRNEWKMAFVMPSKYKEDTAPAPVNNKVQIKRVESSLVAVIAFSGYVSDEEVAKKEQELRKSLESDPDYHVKPSVEARIAQYNPPFTPPWFRRNELMVEVGTKA